MNTCVLKPRAPKPRALKFWVLLAASTALPALASAQLSISRFVIAGGGDRSTGGGFILTGTIAQAEAGPDTGAMSGGGRTLRSGFWYGNPPPCPSDFNGDGFVSADDFDAFVEAFVLGNELADINADGFVNGDDYDAYVDQFVAGC